MFTMTRNQFTEVVDPVICTMFDGLYEEADDEYNQVFDEAKGVTRRYQEFVDMYGVGLPEEIEENGPVTYDGTGIAFRYYLFFRQWGIAVSLSELLIKDGEAVDMAKVATESCSDAMHEQVELQHVQYILGATDVAITKLGDGQPLLSAARPLFQPAVTGATWSNLLPSTAFSETAIEQISIQASTTVDLRGKLKPRKLKTLVIGPSNKFLAKKIKGSMLNTTVAGSNVVNVARTEWDDTVVLSRMGSSPIWGFITDNRRGFVHKYRDRRIPTRTTEPDFNTDAVRIKFKKRYGYGNLDAHSFFGSDGE